MTALSLLALQSAPSPLPLAVLSPHHHPPRLIPTSLPTSHFITAVTIPSPTSSFTPILPPHRRSPNHPLSSTPPSSHLISVLPPHRCPPHFITGILPPHHHPPISSPTSHFTTTLHLITNLPPHHHPPHLTTTLSSHLRLPHLTTTLPSHRQPSTSSPSSHLTTTLTSHLRLPHRPLTPSAPPPAPHWLFWRPGLLCPPQASFFSSAVQLSPTKPINNSLLIKVQSGK